jgi:chromosome partitioning protein
MVQELLREIDRQVGSRVRVSGVVPTFFDASTAQGAVDSLQLHFKERLCEPIRRSRPLAEAVSRRQTIFEYAPHSAGAHDYRRLVERYLAPPPFEAAAQGPA